MTHAMMAWTPCASLLQDSAESGTHTQVQKFTIWIIHVGYTGSMALMLWLDW
jgi:hypothetical protein